ncbi:polymorphic toxin-type HINT domain-containing protein [Nocardiopsis tropica]|uniref:polymorphic toxin-type HINT domain-containing protein n=1 Tax=Nocardiopsis tropica TaxID=109330 RepID=UPI002E85A443|nr:polymorphic toxin-type HINT domain-containing protein [Nocardiopsis tropica]
MADELGITAGLECFTTGDLGACGETALNVASMFVGGLAGKIDNLCAPGNSFVPGTRVLMADGSTRPIEEVDVGEKVLATDPETGERTARTVLATIVGSGAKHLVQITVDPTTEREAADEDNGSDNAGEQVGQSGIPGPVAAGDVIIATDGHPFWVPDLEQWVDAIDLAPGMWLQTSSGTWVQVSAVQAWIQPATVHNLTVQGVHTFHVAAGDLNVLNHNCGGPGGASSAANGARLSEELRDQAGPLGSIQNVRAIYENPESICGAIPNGVRASVGTNPNWRHEGLGRGDHAGQGWLYREYDDRGVTTGSMIRRHPGGGHYGPSAYWRVIRNDGFRWTDLPR